jgi:class 3 adenylate cyclase/tetratricopeptide (TPR) repeat protein
VVACPACATESPPHAKFCAECGRALPRTCPECGAAADRGRFCAECGAALDAAPDHAVGQPRPVAERRVTSVLFGDLVGFTPLSESRDPEEVRELLSRYFTEARTVVARYGGTVEKFIGDAVMAVWGVPVAHEDDAERSVRAGLELVAMVGGFGEEVGAPGLAMRVGVVTGEVAVTVGAVDEGMVAGDAVNTAARVQSVADPGRVWVDEATRALTSAAIAYDDVGEHELKGKSEPLQLFAARSVVASVGGAQRVDGLEAPLTGRDRELRLVKELFHATEESRRPSLVVVEGEPGVGKSRLAWEFEKYIDGLSYPVRWHRGRCLSYGEGVAFWALAECVRGRLGLVESDTGPVVAERLEVALDELVHDADEREWLRPRLAVLLGAGPSGGLAREDLFGAWTTFLERVGRGEHPVVLVLDDTQHADEGLLDFLEHLLGSARSPVFVLALARSGLLERRPSLATTRRTTVLHLEPLDDRDMSDLLDGLVAGLPAPTRALLVQRAEGIPLFAVETVRSLIDRDLVVPRDGRYVLADGRDIDVGSVAAPASLQAIVAARLDTLAPVERRVVADASVLGGVFPRTAVAALAQDVPDLDAVLAALVHKQLLSVQTDRLSSERGQYRFVQTVVRQVAYDTLSRRDRKSRHLAAAEHLRGLPDPGDELAAVIAQHYLDAVDASTPADADTEELVVSATVLLERAASRASALGAPAEALRHLEAAIARTDDPVERARLLELGSRAALHASRYDRAMTLAVAAIDIYDGLGDVVGAGRTAAVQAGAVAFGYRDNARALALLTPRWEAVSGRADADDARLVLASQLTLVLGNLGELDASMAYADQRLRLAERVGDRDHLVDALIGLALFYGRTGAWETAIILLTGAAELGRRYRLLHPTARALMNLNTHLFERDLPRAMAAGREALLVARQSGSLAWQALTTVNAALACWDAGEWDEMRALLGDSAEVLEEEASLRAITVSVETLLAEASGEPVPELPSSAELRDSDNESDLSWGAFADLLRARQAGEPAAAAAFGEESVEHALRWSGVGDDFVHLWPTAVEVALEAGDTERALRLLAIVEELQPGQISPGLLAHRLRAEALVGLATGVGAEATEQRLRAALDAFEVYGGVPGGARTREVLARLLADGGRVAEAETLVGEVRATYEKLGAGGWLQALDDWVSAALVRPGGSR